MKKIKSKKLIKKLRNIEGRLLLIGSMIEVVKDSCLQNDYTNQETVLETILNNYYEIIETISLMY